MAAAYSMDLRERVLKDSDAGLSSKELAERYHVSRAWPRTFDQVCPLIAAALGLFTATECRHFVRHCGYRVATALRKTV